MKVDKKTGDFFAFGYSMKEPYLNYSLINKNRELTNYVKVRITSARMIHDMLITENYMIFPDLPAELSPPKFMT